jgi:hypothetical protein
MHRTAFYAFSALIHQNIEQMMQIDYLAQFLLETLYFGVLFLFTFVTPWTITRIVAWFGHDREFSSKNETLCVDVNYYAELTHALKILKTCSVLQLSTLKHVNSQHKIIFKIQFIISERDFAAICSEVLHLLHIKLNLEIFSIQRAVFDCLEMSGTWSKQFQRILK